MLENAFLAFETQRDICEASGYSLVVVTDMTRVHVTFALAKNI